MHVNIRQAEPRDAAECGRICYEAFAALATAHNFTPDLPNADVATGLVSMLLGSKGLYAIVAELEGRIVGSNFVNQQGIIHGIGPITIDPQVQNEGVGGRLMRAALSRTQQKGAAGVRLVQAGYHCRSLSLYSKLGFEVREHLCCLQGPALVRETPGYRVRPAGEHDVVACNSLAERVHGHHRGAELCAAVSHGTAAVVERAGHITGYATQIAFFGHACGETTDDIKALISASKDFAGPGFLVPSRNGELLRWCLQNKMRITQPLTLMTMGLYNEPAGAYLPSIIF